MIDIHSHILYGVDDGSPTMEESVKMLKKAHELGITTIFATPHYQENLFNLEGITQRFLEVVEKAWEYGITLKPGSEVYINPFIDRLVKEKKILLLNRSDYILLELPYESIPLYVFELIYKLQLQRISIILAHPERNVNLIKDFSIFSNFLERGCMMQVDAGSIAGAYGTAVEQYTKRLVKLKLVHFIASDAHCAKDYEEWYLKAHTKVCRWAGSEYADKLFLSNPKLILDNDKESIYNMV
jgi:protein-tyrosine phosphatase